MVARSIVFLALSLPALASAADAGGIRGRLIDASTGRPVGDATVQLMRGSEVRASVQAQADGSYVFNDVPEGVYLIRVGSDDYLLSEQPDVRVVLRRVSPVDFSLVRSRGDVVEEVVVSARTPREDPSAAANAVSMDREQIRRNPGSAGDVFRALDVMPGVVATGEFSNFTVRGNGPRDNLIRIDGLPFDKVVHFDDSLGEQEEFDGGGRYSIFAPNLIGNARFSPGGWRVAEGGKNGSLLELDVAQGNEFSSTLGARIDIIGLEVDYDGPSYIADNTSVLISARSFDFSNLFEAVDEPDIGAPKLTDLIFKSVTREGDHQFEVLAIQASETYDRTIENALESPDYEDVSLQSSEQDNTLVGVTWRWSPSDALRLRNAFYWSHSDGVSDEGEAYPDLAGPDPTPATTPVRPDLIHLESKEQEIGWRGDVNWTLPIGGTLSTGVQFARVDLDYRRELSEDWTRFVYDSTDYRADPSQNYIVLTPEGFDSTVDASANRYAAYLDYTWEVADLSITPGVRYDHDGFADESFVSPRLLMDWNPDARTRVWGAAGVYYQAPRYAELGADPTNLQLDYERSTQVSIGLSRYLTPELQFYAEAYHQKLEDLIVMDDRTDGIARNGGEGEASGIDLMLSRRLTDTWSASATYSYSRATRDDGLGEGEYDADWHRPHAFAVTGSWQPTDRWTFAAKWRYASGRPTDPYVVHDDVLEGGPLRYSKEYIGNNTLRLPAYHALSLRVDYRRRFGPVSLIAFLDVLNVYGRENGNGYEWDERRGVDIIEGLDSPLPTIGIKFEYSWTPRN